MLFRSLRSLYEPLRAKGANIYFVSANNEWNKLATESSGKIKYSIKEEADSLLRITPGNTCPDPVEINLTDNLTIIAFNSEWWLYPFDYTNIDDNCECKTKSDVLARLDALRYKNKHKFILFTSHHPFQSYGVHGGKGTLKDHLFPLTAVNKSLYIPLPVAGSVYRFFRSSFASPGNIKHPLYKDMQLNVDDIFKDFPNLVHVSDHESGLQFIKDKSVQVLSGPGAKHISARKGKHSLFATTNPGYVTADRF